MRIAMPVGVGRALDGKFQQRVEGAGERGLFP